MYGYEVAGEWGHAVSHALPILTYIYLATFCRQSGGLYGEIVTSVEEASISKSYRIERSLITVFVST